MVYAQMEWQEMAHNKPPFFGDAREELTVDPSIEWTGPGKPAAGAPVRADVAIVSRDYRSFASRGERSLVVDIASPGRRLLSVIGELW
jgi:hypothetical protein